MPRTHSLFIVLLIALLASCANLDRGPIVVGSDLDNAPFAYLDATDQPAGRDVEMMQSLAAHIGRSVEWRIMDFDQLLTAVETGAVDVVCATIGVTEDRRMRVAFTRPYYRTAIATVVRIGYGEPRNLTQLEGRRVAAAAGTTSEFAARRLLPQSKLVLDNEKGLGAAERLTSGEVDALVMDAPAADALIEANRGHFVRLAEDLAQESYALALARENDDLLHELNRALYELELGGGMAELDVRYGVRSSARR